MCVSWSGAIAVSQGHHHSRSLFIRMCGLLTDRNIGRFAEVLYVRFVQLIRDIYQAISQPNTLLDRSKPFTHQARHPCPQPLLNVVTVASPWTPA